MNYFPERIVCLTEEPTETLYLLGEEKRIVGISTFTKRPSRARKEKPKVSAFIDAKIDEIIALEPDLVIGFSDIQAKIAQQLIQEGITVWINNHRNVDEIFKMIVQLGSLVGKQEEAMELVSQYQNRMQSIAEEVAQWKMRPKVYFEEWYDPLISGIQWVGELIEIAGGEELFPEFRNKSLAKDRMIHDDREIIKRNPDIILASWCGKKFKPKRLINREGWGKIKAVQEQEVYEIDSTVILQPGPASISEGLETMFSLFFKWNQSNEKK